MSICTATGTSTGEKGCQKYTGEQVHILYFDSEQEVDITSLQSQPFVEALISASSNRASILKDANEFEIVVPETTKYTPTNGSAEILKRTSAGLTIKHKSGNVIRRTLAELDNKEMHVFILTKQNILAGIRSDYDKLKTVKATAAVIDEVMEGSRELRGLELTYDDVDWFNVKKEIALGWNIKDINPLTGLYIYAAGTSTSVTATVTDADDTMVTGLTVAQFSMYNITDGAAVTIDTVVDNADGTYTVPITTGASATDVIEVRYAGPSSTNLYKQIDTKQLLLLT